VLNITLLNTGGYMAKVNISQAAHMAGVSRPTIHKKINTGELSVDKANGKTFIDVSELERVFGTLIPPGTLKPNRQDLHVETPQVITILQSQLDRLQHELEVIRQERDSERRARERGEAEHRVERERLYEIIEKQTLLLPTPKDPAENKGWWRRWFT
jgi:Helix-turn-helix domain